MGKAETLQAEREQYGRRLRELREAAGLTRGELAGRCFTQRGIIIRAEEGHGFLSQDTAGRIAAVLSCDPLEIGPPVRRLNRPVTEERKEYEARYAGWGLRIRERREAAGLSQRQLAQLLYTHQTTLGGWERGKNIPRKEERERLKKLLGVGAPGEPDGPMGPEVMQIIRERQEEEERAAAAKAAAAARKAEREKAKQAKAAAAERARQEARERKAKQAAKPKKPAKQPQAEKTAGAGKRGRPAGQKRPSFVQDPARMGPIALRDNSRRQRYAGYGRQIQKKREEAGLTVKDLAGLMNTSVQVVNKWECGTSIPTDADRQKLEELIGVEEPPAVVVIAPARGREEPRRAELPSDRMSCYAREAEAAGMSYGQWVAATTERQRNDIWAGVERQRRARQEERKAARERAAAE